MPNLQALQDWALVTPQQVKTHVRIDNDDDDDLIILLINAATKKCEDHCRRAFIQRSVTENRIGDGGNILLLNKRPVDTLSSITLDGSTLTEDDDFTLYKEEGYMERPVGTSFWSADITRLSWTKGAKIVITYTAGYSATRAQAQYEIPEIALGVLIAVSNWYENRLGVSQESSSGIGSQAFEIGELPEQTKRILGGLQTNLGIL
uniref:Putative head-tail connector n=2 Tax=viral metagenome TaxID=1070528 RepID=A0A6M3IN45_9ZZZZ